MAGFEAPNDSISLTASEDKEDVLSVIEPNASSISDRINALKKAHWLKLRTYGMLCPLLPGIGDDPTQIERLIHVLNQCGVEEVFAEAVNPRGNGLKNTEQALRQKGFITEAERISAVRKKLHWSPYVARLIHNVQNAVRSHIVLPQLDIE